MNRAQTHIGRFSLIERSGVGDDADKINAIGVCLRIFGEPDRRRTSRTLDKTAANRLFLRCTACDVDRATAAAAAARGARDRGGSVRPN